MLLQGLSFSHLCMLIHRSNSKNSLPHREGGGESEPRIVSIFMFKANICIPSAPSLPLLGDQVAKVAGQEKAVESLLTAPSLPPGGS